jgi:hypothetical protein
MKSVLNVLKWNVDMTETCLLQKTVTIPRIQASDTHMKWNLPPMEKKFQPLTVSLYMGFTVYIDTYIHNIDTHTHTHTLSYERHIMRVGYKASAVCIKIDKQ